MSADTQNISPRISAMRRDIAARLSGTAFIARSAAMPPMPTADGRHFAYARHRLDDAATRHEI